MSGPDATTGPDAIGDPDPTVDSDAMDESEAVDDLAVDDLAEEDLAEEDLDVIAGMSVVRNLGQVAGTVHGGMYNVTHVYQQVRRLREYHELSGDYLRRFRQGFVERVYQTVNGRALDSQGAAELLETYQCLVLLGDPDSGRHTAAVGLLHRLDLPLREVGGWDPAQGERFAPTDLPSEPGHGYLLELPDGPTPDHDIGRQLMSYRDRLRALGSYLVVVSTPETWTASGGYRDGSVLGVSRPDPRSLLTCEIRLLSPERDLSPLVTNPALMDLLPTATPREVARLAHLLVAASLGARNQVSPEIVASAVSAYKNWDSELASWFQRHGDVRERLFLVAAAVLEGFPGGLVLRCAEELGERLGGSARRPGLDEAGIRELAQSVGACVEVDGTVRFGRPAYASAVIDFVCADRSDAFRTLLWEWAARLPLGVNPGRSATVLADRVAEVILDAVTKRRDPRPLRRFVHVWASRLDLRPVVIDLLTAAALSPQTGAAVRALLNRWAIRGTGPELLSVVAEVCRGELADAYPRVALTRLNHLAAKSSAEAADSVVEAVANLWLRPGQRRAVLRRIVAWLTGPEVPAFEVACRLLLVLTSTVDPQSTIIRVALAEPADRVALAGAVGRVLERRNPPGEAVAAVAEWLSQAVGEPALAEPLISTLVAAVRGRAPARRIARLQMIAYGWQSGSDSGLASSRRWLCDQLVERLAAIDPLPPLPDQLSEGAENERGRSWQG